LPSHAARHYDPRKGTFTQEDPIGLAGGLNLYGFANGDPINFSDPFGLCPWCIFEVAASIFDAVDLAVTAGRYLAGSASREELGVTALGAAAGVVGFGGGAGRAGRQALRRGGAAQEAAALALPRMKNGRLSGALPSVDDLGDLTRGDLVDFADDLRTSIDARRTIGRQHPNGFDRGHTRRLEDEMELLRVAENRLSGG